MAVAVCMLEAGLKINFRVDKKRDRLERQILDSQERAFWDVHRPVPGCVNTTEIDFRKLSRSGRPKYSASNPSLLLNTINNVDGYAAPTPSSPAAHSFSAIPIAPTPANPIRQGSSTAALAIADSDEPQSSTQTVAVEPLTRGPVDQGDNIAHASATNTPSTSYSHGTHRSVSLVLSGI